MACAIAITIAKVAARCRLDTPRCSIMVNVATGAAKLTKLTCKAANTPKPVKPKGLRSGESFATNQSKIPFASNSRMMANITTITDFVKGETIEFKGASGTSTFTSTKLDVSAATTLAAALDLAAATNVSANDAAVKWFQFGGDTYVVQDLSTNTALAATDVVVKLVGAQDLSTATLSGTEVLTW